MSSSDQDVLIIANPRFTYLPQNPSIATSNCPESVNYNVAVMKGTSNQSLSFQLDVNGAFLNRGVMVDIPKIPLKFTRKIAIDNTAPAAAKTIADFFGDWDSIALRQFAFLNGIDSIKTTIDGQIHHTCTEVAKCLGVVSQYYNKTEVHESFNSSLADMYPSYDDYGNAQKSIDVVDVGGNIVTMKKPVLSNDNPFSSISDEFSTRIPMMSKITAGDVINGASKTLDVYLHGQRCPLPFNIFGIAKDELPLYLAKTIMVDIKMKSNWWRELFSIVPGSGSDMSNIEFVQSSVAEFTPRINYTLYTGPAYQEKDANKIDKFFLGTPTVTVLTGGRQEEVKAREKKRVQQMSFAMDNIPIRAYVYVKALYKKVDVNDALRTAHMPDLYGRIDSLSVKVTNTETRIASDDSGRLFDLCKAAGLNKSFEQASYLTGYSVCLDMSEALSTKSNTLVSSAPSGASPTISVDLSFTNLSSEEIVYEIGCIAVYDTILSKKDGKWEMRSTITADTFSTDQHIHDALAEATVQKGNMIGSGFLDTIWGAVKKVGPGLWNLGKAVLTNKDGFRDNLVKKWEGNGFGGAFDSRIPTFGGGLQYPNNTNVTGGRSIDSWTAQ